MIHSTRNWSYEEMIEEWTNKKAEEYLDIIKNHVAKDSPFLMNIALHLAYEHQNLSVSDNSSFFDLNGINDEHTTCFIQYMCGGQEKYIKDLWSEAMTETRLNSE
jgi:hypothetical protein